MELIHLAYISVATDKFETSELGELLTESRVNNEKYEITGMLLHAGFHFVQLIEGPKTNIDHLYQTLLADERHRNVTRILYDAIDHRSFPNWSMGFETADAEAVRELTGFSDFLLSDENTLSDEIQAGIGRRTLERFKGNYSLGS